MDISNKIVTAIPLKQLWNDKGLIQADRGEYLTREALTAILMISPVQFVIANVGEKLAWIPVHQCFDNWKSGIKEHVADDINKLDPEKYPNTFVYAASKWESSKTQIPIILLEKYH